MTWLRAFALLLLVGGYKGAPGAGFIAGAVAEDPAGEASGVNAGSVSESRFDGILGKTAVGVGLALAGTLIGNLLGRRIFASSAKQPMEHYSSKYVLPSLEESRRREYCRFTIPASALTNGEAGVLVDGEVVVSAVESGRYLELKSAGMGRIGRASQDNRSKIVWDPLKSRQEFKTVIAVPEGCEYSRHLPANYAQVMRGRDVLGVELQLPQEEFAHYEPSNDKMPPATKVVPSVAGLGVVSVGRCHYEASGAFLQPVDPGSLVLESSLRQFRISAKRDGREVTLAQFEYPCECRPDLHYNVIFWTEEMDVAGKVGVKVYVKVLNQPWDLPLGECFSQELVQVPFHEG